MSMLLLQPKSIPTPVELAVQLRESLLTRASDGAIFLQQLHYWICKGQGKVVDGIRWIYNTYDEWRQADNMPWLSEWDFRVITSALHALGLIRSEFLSDDKRDRTKYYTINYEHPWIKTYICEDDSDASEDSNPVHPSVDPESRTEITPQIIFKEQQQNAAAFLEKTVEEETSSQSLATLIDQTELVDDEPELIDEDHFSEAPQPQKLVPEEYRQILSEVRAADVPLSPELQRLVLKSSVEVVRSALAALLERRLKSNVANPAGYLTRAIQGQWKPTVAVDVTEHKGGIPEEVRPPSPEQVAQLDAAVAKGKIMDHYLSTINGISIRRVVMLGGIRMVPWWEFLEV